MKHSKVHWESAHRAWRVTLGSLVIVGALTALLAWDPASTRSQADEEASLLVYCAAGIKAPVEQVAREYEQQYGVAIQLQYGGSGTLLSNLRVAQTGDLYIAADSSYIEIARINQLVKEAISLARIRPVLGIRQGNPHNIRTIDDLLRDEVTFALCNPDAASIGKLSRDLLERSGQWSALAKRAKVFKPTVNEVANDVKLGTVDAAIVWDATVALYPELQAVYVPSFDRAVQEVTLGVLTSCRQPRAALHFARYLAARDRGLPAFAATGYRPVEGDVWAEQPELTLFSGGVNRLAIEETLKQFERREGARVNVVYNGCGILVGMMKSGQRPDAYFACDRSFTTEVADLFLDPHVISETAIVLLMPKENPQNIHSLADLAQPGLKLGVANEKQSALGALTQRLLAEAGVKKQVEANIRSRTPTADLLVNQMRTGSLDAVVVYEANTMHVRDDLEIVPIEHPHAKAVQPLVIGRNSQHKHLVGRLLAAITSDASQAKFESTGFRWRNERDPR